MENDVVTIEVAKQLKKKGFRDKVYAYYNRRGQFFEIHPKQDMNDSDYSCSAPTIGIVLRWLRLLKGLDVEVFRYCEEGYSFRITNNKGKIVYSNFTMTDNCYFLWETAAIDGIKYVLDNLI